MAIATLEERVSKIEDVLETLQRQIEDKHPRSKRGWRWFVGIDAENPDFEEAVRQGRQWRRSDRTGEEEPK